ncbi:MAG: PHP domain-containing protein [Acidimicrobiia bacterium]
MIDLHTHSSFSDGSDRPSELVAEAARLGLSAIALTDHDTLEGIEEARRAGHRLGVEMIPGTEISCEWRRGGMHMTVLFLEPGAGPLQDRLATLRASRDGRNALMVDRLRDLGIDITLEEVLGQAGEGTVGRPHVAAVLVRKGVVPDPATAFEELLGYGRPAYLGRERLLPKEAIALARASGARPVLAHPHTLGLDTTAEVAELIGWLADAGLVGLECLYPGYPVEQREALMEMARSFGLLVSGGSDYHGTYKEGIALGSGRGDLAVPDEVLETLRPVQRGPASEP